MTVDTWSVIVICMAPTGRVGGGSNTCDRGISSPDVVLDDSDPGDETQRNFRYQHAYGVVLLVAAARGELPYQTIWCEHHEDLLAERANDGVFDAYQIKTATPENGPWGWGDDGLRNSVKRFVKLHQKFAAQIGAFKFVSNVACLDSHTEKKVARSPFRLLEALDGTFPDSLQKAFDDLRDHCGCSEQDLRTVLSRLELVKGPGRDSFEAELAHEHLGKLEGCSSMTALQRDHCLDRLINIVSRASSLVIRDPALHWCGVNGRDRAHPILRSKRIVVNAVQDVLAEMVACPFNYAPISRFVTIGRNETDWSTMEKKLARGGLSEYVDLLRDRAISAERHLIELAHRRPDESYQILNQTEAVVLSECDEARLEASIHQPDGFGPRMLSEVHRRLRKIAETRSSMVYQQPYEVMAGCVGLLTEECRVWWSQRFDLGETQ